jgi:ammonium transporter, Amt family
MILGWNGFNGGAPYAANVEAGVAVLNTNICAAMSLLTWTLLDMIFFGRPSVIGAVQGMITGLVAITPAAGVVAGWGAIVMGVMAGSIPWFSMHYLRKLWFFRQVDDVLEVFHTHAVAGVMGGIMTGVLATKQGCRSFACVNIGGAAAGYGEQVYIQIVGAIFIVLLNVIMTPIILYGISFIVPLRMTEEQLLVGDAAVHGEDPYCFTDERSEVLKRIEFRSMFNTSDTAAEKDHANQADPEAEQIISVEDA